MGQGGAGYKWHTMEADPVEAARTALYPPPPPLPAIEDDDFDNDSAAGTAEELQEAQAALDPEVFAPVCSCSVVTTACVICGIFMF